MRPADYSGERWRLYVGDCLETMRGMEAGSIDAIVSDPPYGLTQNKRGGSGEASVNLDSPAGRARVTTGFMGMEWDGAVPGAAFWSEALRVAKPGAYLLAFGGTRTFHRLTVAIEDAGWEIRDCLSWLYGQGFPKSHNLRGEHEGWGTALKPSWEPIIMARKPLRGTVAANVEAFGTGALNIDGCRIGTGGDKGIWPITQRHHADVAYTLNPAPTDNSCGRWPANVLLDPEAAEELDRQSGYSSESRTSFTRGGGGKHGRYSEIGEMETSAIYADSGGASRFFYVAKPDKSERDEGLDGLAEKRMKALEGGKVASAKTPESMGGERTGRNHHPTVKPVDLMRYLCRLVTPPGGLVLDPFMGSGTTGRAAIQEGFAFVGCELSPEYAEIAARRIGSAPLPLDFDAPEPKPAPTPKDVHEGAKTLDLFL